MKPLGTGDPLRLGPYRVLGVLGEGGMGKVYVGQDGAGTLAAVKVLKPELAHDTHLAQRFVREAQAAQAVRSKGVANVLGAWTEGGRPWIATEFLAGLTLDQAVEAHGPLDGTAVRALAASLAATLADIHAAGFVHRDLKPPNIVLTSTGPRVIDFGIARPEHGLTLTTTGQVPVTPGYGAPEQVLGQRVAPSADVFSLGAVLVYAATGQRAFDGGHVAAVQYEVVHGEPRLDAVPEPLRQLIGPCLAKDPARRPVPAQIAQAFAPPRNADRAWTRGGLAGAIKERETGAQRLVTTRVSGERQMTSVPRRRLLTTLAVGGTVLAAGGGTTAWWFGRGGPPRRSDPFDIPAAVGTPVAKTDAAPSRKEGLTAEQRGGPRTLWTTPGADAASRELLPVRDVLVFGMAAGGIAAYGVQRGTHRWSAPDVRTESGYVSLSDRLVAAADAHGTVHTFVPATGEAKWTCAAADAQTLLAADHTALYLVTWGGRLRAVRRADAKVAWTADVAASYRGTLRGPATVAGGMLLVPTSQGDLLAVSTADGRTRWTHAGTDETVLRPAVSGGTVYINGGSLTARRLSDGKQLWAHKLDSYSAQDGGYGPPSVMADVLYANAGSFTHCWELAKGEELFMAGEEVDWDSPVLTQGHGLWSCYEDDDSDTGLKVTAMWARDGVAGWERTMLRPHYYRLAAAGNRVFLQLDDSVLALSVF
ncbi:serine/threonine-protein kinase [Streptomyces sp. VRA16 Mangrove soil]|uniref:serine/threonine-protein kinase n=1 Tax=Streptomyces sp. VRA16 Mangrove soil TaxID=2817434 RepID=UPI001A9E4AB4|nr:serine/threonine-protein kinase [Streptomyces sp. VRA16 Mangrove soil]MBO1336051.1 protein kinase [Streptomyces sp. VRA16 Mangrove soil]